MRYDGPIDVVYTWVDGDAPGFAETLARYAGEMGPENADSIPGQLRDLGELRYSIRSVRQNMPLVRDIIILTNGQRPAGLREDDPTLRFVTHAEVYDRPDDLPVFNSLSIEAHLHQIPGLSDCFVYFNNDMFVGLPVARSDVLDEEGRETFLFQPLRLSTPAEGHSHLRLLNHNDGLLRRVYGGGPRLIVPHTPQAYFKARCTSVARTWPQDIAATSRHRFRRPDSAFFRILYTFARLYETYGVLPLQEILIRHHHSVRLATTADCAMLMLTSEPGAIEAAFATLEPMPTFFCVQDHLWADVEQARVLVQAELQKLFPVPSVHETVAAAPPSASTA